jgi:predicted site-specific integrase-resolvase
MKCQQKVELVEKLEDTLARNEKELDEVRKILQNERIQTAQQISNLEREVNMLQTQNNQLNDSVINLLQFCLNNL